MVNKFVQNVMTDQLIRLVDNSLSLNINSKVPALEKILVSINID